MRFGLDEVDLSKLAMIFKGHDRIETAVLFGSRAKGNYKTGSDIDIAVKGEGINLNDLIELSNSYDELLLPYKIDLVIYDRITEPELRNHIDRVGIILYQKSK